MQYHRSTKKNHFMRNCALMIFIGLAMLIGSMALPDGIKDVISISGIMISGSAALVMDMGTEGKRK